MLHKQSLSSHSNIQLVHSVFNTNYFELTKFLLYNFPVLHFAKKFSLFSFFVVLCVCATVCVSAIIIVFVTVRFLYAIHLLLCTHTHASCVSKLFRFIIACSIFALLFEISCISFFSFDSLKNNKVETRTVILLHQKLYFFLYYILNHFYSVLFHTHFFFCL